MDGQRFDALVRSLTESPSRRLLLGGLTGGLLGGVLGLLGLEDAEAAQRKRRKPKRRKKCPKGRKRCGKVCCRKNQVCLNRKCRRKPRKPTCTPNNKAVACAGRDCGTVANDCGGVHTCGNCPTPGTCTAGGQCVGTCGACEGCCDGDTCRTGFEITNSQCGHSGGICRDCGPGLACVSGVCTCTSNSCNDGCCKVNAAGQPYCDTNSRRCADRCAPKGTCCFGGDKVYPLSKEGCWPNESCVVDQDGIGQCMCGNSKCDRNHGCCSLNANNQPFCDTSKRGCGEACINKAICCHEGQQGCDDGVSCTTETCLPSGNGTGAGTCTPTGVSGICPGACAAGLGYGNYFPAKQRGIVCGKSPASDANCMCWRTMDGTSEGANVCAAEDGSNMSCRANTDCPTGEVCIRSGLVTNTNRCARICQ